MQDALRSAEVEGRPAQALERVQELAREVRQRAQRPVQEPVREV
jgi:hypothetical protein